MNLKSQLSLIKRTGGSSIGRLESFLFSIGRLESFSHENLILSSINLESYLKHGNSYDFDGEILFEELKAI
jgi:hypothetical protein